MFFLIGLALKSAETLVICVAIDEISACLYMKNHVSYLPHVRLYKISPSLSFCLLLELLSLKQKCLTT